MARHTLILFVNIYSLPICLVNMFYPVSNLTAMSVLQALLVCRTELYFQTKFAVLCDITLLHVYLSIHFWYKPSKF